MKGCLKLGGDPILNGHCMEIIRDIPDEVVAKLLEKFKLQEFKVKWPMQSWSKLQCSNCKNRMYSAETFEEQMCWTHIHSSLIISESGEEKKQKIFLLCRECADKINYERIEPDKIYHGIA